MRGERGAFEERPQKNLRYFMNGCCILEVLQRERGHRVRHEKTTVFRYSGGNCLVERDGLAASCAHVLHVVSRIAAPGEFIGLTQDAQSTPAPEHALCIASATVSASRFSHKAKMLGPLPDREQPRAPASRAASFT